jgi:hypothetical protein
MNNYFNNYLKYKKKYLLHKKELYNNLIGGKLNSDPVFSKIISIGFEFETSIITPINISNDKIMPYNFGQKDRKQGIIVNDYLQVIDDIPLESNINKINYLNGTIRDYRIKNRKINKIIEYGSDESFQHTEFIVTFSNPSHNNNIIKDKLKDALQHILDYLNDFTQQLVGIFQNGENKHIGFAILYTKLNENFGFLRPLSKHIRTIPMPNDDIYFVPQMTFGCKLKDVEAIGNKLNNIFGHQTYFGKFFNYAMNTLEPYWEHFHVQMTPELRNFLYLIFYYFWADDKQSIQNATKICKLQAEGKFDKEYFINEQRTYFKAHISLLLRHKHSDIYNKLKSMNVWVNPFPEWESVKNVFNSNFVEIKLFHFMESHNIVDYINDMEIGKMNKNHYDPKMFPSTTYDLNIHNDDITILVEYRHFNNHIKKYEISRTIADLIHFANKDAATELQEFIPNDQQFKKVLEKGFISPDKLDEYRKININFRCSSSRGTTVQETENVEGEMDVQETENVEGEMDVQETENVEGEMDVAI